MATIGRRSAVVELPHGARIHGTLAWLAWLGLHLFYLLGGRNRLSALVNLSYRYLVWGHGGGVIVGDDPPAGLGQAALPGRKPGRWRPQPAHWRTAGRRLLTMNRADEIPAAPPEQVAAGPLVLRRVHADRRGRDRGGGEREPGAPAPWMPWATPEAADLRSQLVRVAEADEMWESGTGFIYVMIARDHRPARPAGMVKDPDGEFVGTIGLHRRPGDDAVEIGYWTVAAKTRRGYATAAAQALTPVALALPGTRRVEIHCDEANTASAGVPRKLGYRLDRVEQHEREAPGERGRRMIWVWDPAEGPRATGPGRARGAVRCPVKAASLARGAVLAACGLALAACALLARRCHRRQTAAPGTPAAACRRRPTRRSTRAARWAGSPRPGHPAAEPVRPADGAEPVPRQGVVLAFVDSECTTVCPLTTVSMVEAKELLGAAGSHVQLLGRGRQPQGHRVSDVMAYSRAHAMVNQWDFLTGTPAAAPGGLAGLPHRGADPAGDDRPHPGPVRHRPAGPRAHRLPDPDELREHQPGRADPRRRGVSSLLPGHPPLASTRSLAYISGQAPAARVTLPGVPSGSVTLGPGQPRLVMFFATWVAETSDLRAHLLALNSYARARRGTASCRGWSRWTSRQPSRPRRGRGRT